ncbi:MAG: hypothetical protein ACRDQW_17665 [Haloechinothrix sp.]
MEYRRQEQDAAEAELSRAEQDLRSAVRLEAEEDERQAAQLARRKRSLADVAFEAMSRGDRVAAGLGARTFTGRVVYSTGSLMTLEADGATVDFNLEGPIQLRVIESARSGGGSRADGPGSFRGRLLELEVYPDEIEVGSPLYADGLRGKIQVTAQDHLLVTDAAGSDWYLPLAWIGYVARRHK